MKILVVAQHIQQYKNKERFSMPLGIAYVNGALRAAGFDVHGINLMFVNEHPYDALFHKIREEHFDILLCGGLSAEYPVLKGIYDTAKLANPQIITIGGGGGFSANPIIFSQLTGVDYAVIGEGEITDVELINAIEKNLDIANIKGIVYRAEDGYHQTPPREPIEDLDSIPFPSYEGLAMEEYLSLQQIDGWYNYYTYYSDTPRFMPMLMSRSCPYMCSFCFHPMGRGYRSRGLDNFFEELELWIQKYQINGIALVDECFSMNPDTVVEFCKRIKPYHISWACQMRAEIYNYDLMKLMKESGCIGACFGIESMSEAVLQNMQKHLKQETIENALKVSYECGIGTSGNLIFGSENETFETVWESICWNRKHLQTYHQQPIKAFTYIQTYPGSKYYRNAVSKGLIKDEAEFIKNGQWIFNITEMSDWDYGIVGEVGRLLQYEKCPQGKLLSLEEQKDSRLTVTFQCPHCGSIHTYHNLSRRHLPEQIIRSLGCRTCNGMADYPISDKYQAYDHYYIVDWLLKKLEVGDEDVFNQYIISQILSQSKQNNVSVGILGSGYAASKLTEILLNAGRDNISIKWVLQRKELNAMPQNINVINNKDALTPVSVVINTELTQPEWSSRFVSYGTSAVDLEQLIRTAIGHSTPNSSDGLRN